MYRRPLIIFVVAVMTRLLALAIIDPTANLLGGDDTYYLKAAAQLMHGVVLTERPPGYPLFLALTGASLVTSVVAQMALGIGTAIATYFLLDRTRAAFVVSLLLASSPFLAIYELKLVSEAVYIPLVWLGLLLLFKRQNAIAAGLLLGAAILVRDTMLLFPLFVVAFYRPMKPALITAAIAFACVAPMYLFAGKLSEGRFGYNLWIGTWERNGAWMLNGIEKPDYPANAFRNETEKQVLAKAYAEKDDTAFKRVAIDRITQTPASTAMTWVARYPRLWLGTRSDQFTLRAERGGAPWTLLKVGLFALNLVTLLIGLLGIWLYPRWRFLALPVLYAALVYTPFHNVEPRYTLFAFPALYLFAGLVIAGRLKPRDHTPAEG